MTRPTPADLVAAIDKLLDHVDTVMNSRGGRLHGEDRERFDDLNVKVDALCIHLHLRPCPVKNFRQRDERGEPREFEAGCTKLLVSHYYHIIQDPREWRIALKLLREVVALMEPQISDRVNVLARESERERRREIGETESSSEGDEVSDDLTAVMSDNRAARAIQLKVESWETLSIGIDEEGSFLGVSSALDYNSVFPRESAVSLTLKGDRWVNILDLLANSDDGRSAAKNDLMVKFGYWTTAIVSTDIAEDPKLQAKVKSASKSLTQAIGDLSRQLRDRVAANDDQTRKNPPLSVADAGQVKALFTCRYLLRDSGGKLRFRKPK